MSASPFDQAHLSVLQRGWLSSNNTLLHGNGSGAVLIDAGHVTHAAQTVALVADALRGEPLQRIANTHLHSDHCGGNAALQRAFGCRIDVPPGSWFAVQKWDEQALGYAPTNQRCERFEALGTIEPGTTLEVGTQVWSALAAPGHDPHSLIFLNARHGILISADALWERGFGVVFPELDGESAFDDVEQVLDLIASLGVRWVIPGHGAPFADVTGALQRARERLAAFRAQPARHARHAVKALVTFHVMEESEQPLEALLDWFCATPLMGNVWDRLQRPQGNLRVFAASVVDDLRAAGVLRLREGLVSAAPVS